MQKPFGSENFISLVPRPFPPPIFDGFQYTNMDGNEAKKSLCVPRVKHAWCNILLASPLKSPCSECYNKSIDTESMPYAQNIEICHHACNIPPAKENDCLICEPRRQEAEAGCIAVIVTTLPCLGTYSKGKPQMVYDSMHGS